MGEIADQIIDGYLDYALSVGDTWHEYDLVTRRPKPRPISEKVNLLAEKLRERDDVLSQTKQENLT